MTPANAAVQVHGIFDPATWTVTYVVHQGAGTACAVIDSVLDYDPKSGRTRHTSADKVIDYVRSQNLTVQWILETHAHADHLSAAPYLKAHLGGKTAIGANITSVQKVFKGIFNLGPDFAVDGRQFDHLLADGEFLAVGGLRIQAHMPDPVVVGNFSGSLNAHADIQKMRNPTRQYVAQSRQRGLLSVQAHHHVKPLRA